MRVTIEEVEKKLRTLRLPGMAQTLQSRCGLTSFALPQGKQTLP